MPYTVRIVFLALIAAGLAFAAQYRISSRSAALAAMRDTRSNAGRVDLPTRKARRTKAALVLAEISRSQELTYVADILKASDSSLARWPDRTTRPVTVWIQNGARVRGWWPAAARVAWKAFADWEKTGIPVRFIRAMDSASADIRVTWTHRFDAEITGRTTWARNGHWWITDADVTLAMRHANGIPLDATAMRAIALHEIGHLLGLAHSSHPSDIMSPTVRVSRLSPADQATARLLYRLPPGPVRD